MAGHESIPSPTPKRSRRPHSIEMITIFAALGVWSFTAIAVGGVSLHRPWGMACLIAGSVSAVILGLSIMRQSWRGALYGTLIASCAGLILAGGMLPSVAVVLTGMGCMILVGATVPIVLMLSRAPAGGTASGEAGVDDLRLLVGKIEEHVMLSDNAKRVLFRERELEMLRAAIEADIKAGHYNAALRLCDEMADVFGYREQAESFRGQILQYRQQHYNAAIHDELARFDTVLAGRDWVAVHHEAARLRRLYHDAHFVHDLDRRIMNARDEHKNELEQEFLVAAGKDDVEGAMELLRTLDRYLKPEDAERLSEVAHGVVSRHRENLGVQFKMAVADHRWAEAARIGDEITGDYPNTKMAEEVRSMIDLIRTRAAQSTLVADDP